MSDLNDILREIGTLTVPSTKEEIYFAGETGDDEFWVVVRHHLPDGSYTEADTFKYRLTP